MRVFRFQLLALLLAITGEVIAQPAWKPDRAVEIVAGAGARQYLDAEYHEFRSLLMEAGLVK